MKGTMLMKMFWEIWNTIQMSPGKSHGRRSLVRCSPWGRQESDTTEQPDFHFSLSRIGEGNGNPLQCCCLENPRDAGAWLAAVYEVTQSRTRLKRLSSSSSIQISGFIISTLRDVTCIISNIDKDWAFRVALACQCRRLKRCMFNPGVRKIP